MSTTQRILVNVGCGHQRPAGWINTDCSLNAMIQRVPVIGGLVRGALRSTAYSSGNVSYLNLTKRWPFADGTVDVVYGSHVFEHLSMSGARHFLREAMRVLRPGGVLRLVVPDLYQAAKAYVTELEGGNAKASERLLFTLNLHRENTYPAPLARLLSFFPGASRSTCTVKTRIRPRKGPPTRSLTGRRTGRTSTNTCMTRPH